MSIRRLKLRQPLDVLANEPRRHSQTVIRFVYLAAVAALLLWLADFFIGDWFYFRSEGIVLGEPAVVAAEFPLTVREIRVAEGERVQAGQVVALVSSLSVTESLARLAGEQAERDLRMSDLRIRSQTIDAIIGLAHARQNVTVDARQKLESLRKRGYLTLDQRTAAVDSEFHSSEDFAQLQAQQRAMSSQIATLAGALAQADGAVNQLLRLYDDGQLAAPSTGVVGRRLAENGAVLAAGQPLLEIYDDRRFVLAYVPTGGLFHVTQGQSVQIRAGLQTFVGTIVRVEPIADALPREFQRAFTPVDRQQVIRVDFSPGQTPPPLFSKVTLSSTSVLPSWAPSLVRSLL
jgi:multidrug resistance efflux pump